jgi:CRP-like cAMP-binding protein
MHTVGMAECDDELEAQLYQTFITETEYMDEREYEQHTSTQRIEKLVQNIIREHIQKRDGAVNEPKIIIIMNLIRMMKNKGFQEVVQLGAGQCFGELALIQKFSTRAATIKCMKECHFGILTRQDYEKTLKYI